MKRILYIITAVVLISLGMTACNDPDDTPATPEVEGYEVGDLYKKGSVVGVVFKLNDEEGTSGMIFSLDEWSAKWSTVTGFYEAMSPDNGLYNWSIITSLQGWEVLFPAFGCCNTLNGGFVTGWHLPCQYDVEYIADAIGHCHGESFEAINKTLVENGGVALSPDYYWSSSEGGPALAYSISLETGTFDPYKTDKSMEFRVRAVKHF